MSTKNEPTCCLARVVLACMCTHHDSARVHGRAQISWGIEIARVHGTPINASTKGSFSAMGVPWTSEHWRCRAHSFICIYICLYTYRARCIRFCAFRRIVFVSIRSRFDLSFVFSRAPPIPDSSYRRKGELILIWIILAPLIVPVSQLWCMCASPARMVGAHSRASDHPRVASHVQASLVQA